MKKLDERYDVIVIGGGPNGLTALRSLSRASAGAKVLLLERHHEGGGGLITEEWSGFRFNTHAKLMLMMDVMPPYRRSRSRGLGMSVSEARRGGLHPDPRRAGHDVLLGHPEDRAEHRRFSPNDAERYVEVMEDWYTIVNEALIPATYSLPLPMLDMVVSYQQSEVGEVINEMAEENFLETLDAAGFENELLETALLYLGTMYGMDPEGGLGFMLPLFVTRLLHASIVHSGSHQLAASISRFANRHGATLERAAEVAKILTDGTKAVGVRLASGEEILAEKVVATTDPQTTFLELVGEETCRAASGHARRDDQELGVGVDEPVQRPLCAVERPRYEAASPSTRTPTAR